jgi:hypothetical protein
MKFVRALQIKRPSGTRFFLTDKPGDKSPGYSQASRWDVGTRLMIGVNRPWVEPAKNGDDGDFHAAIMP